MLNPQQEKERVNLKVNFYLQFATRDRAILAEMSSGLPCASQNKLDLTRVSEPHITVWRADLDDVALNELKDRLDRTKLSASFTWRIGRPHISQLNGKYVLASATITPQDDLSALIQIHSDTCPAGHILVAKDMHVSLGYYDVLDPEILAYLAEVDDLGSFETNGVRLGLSGAHGGVKRSLWPTHALDEAAREVTS